jgi:L-ascorbate metabolism protein UlaG (beta-lactamase superfamily)
LSLEKFPGESPRDKIFDMTPVWATIAAGILTLGTVAAAASTDTISTAAGPVEITPVQHASFTLTANGKLIYVDPSPAGLFLGKPKADLIIITDVHQDHFDPGAIKELSRSGTKVIAPAAVQKTESAAEALRNGQQTSWNGWTIEAVPMYNEKRGPAPGQLFHPKGRGNGYVLTYGGKRFYISGDTENIPEVRALKNIDVAFVCMNLPYTMPVSEAADAVKAFHPKIVYPYHYRGQDTKQFAKLLEGSGIDVRLRDWYAK